MNALRILRRVVLRFRKLLGYVPNVEWLRARLSRATLLDRALAQAAFGEAERCLRQRATGGYCGRFAGAAH